MAKVTRGEFPGFGAALAGVGAGVSGRRAAPPAPRTADRSAPALAPGGQAAGPGVEVDLIVGNACAYTMDDAHARAEAFAVEDGRFIAVGAAGDVCPIRAVRTVVGGRTVYPKHEG